jgi:biopolymer transport protein ExbB
MGIGCGVFCPEQFAHCKNFGTKLKVVDLGEAALRFFLHLTSVLLPFLLLLGGVLCLERLFFFHRTRVRLDLLLPGLRNLLVEGRQAEALALCEQTPGSLARVLKRILLVANWTIDRMEREYLLQEDWEIQILERRMGSIALLARVLPMLGFLGTAMALLLGFIRGERLGNYASIASFADVLTGAFSAAIVGMAGGLFLDMGYHILHGRLRSCVREIRSGAREFFCEWLALTGGDQGPCRSD